MQTAVPAENTRRLKPEFFIAVPIVGITYFNKIVITVSSTAQINVSLIALLLALAGGYLGGYFRIAPKIFFAFLAMCAALIFTQLFSLAEVSFLSLALLFIVCAMHMFELKEPTADPLYRFNLFQRIMVVISIFGIAQYFLQFVIGDWAFAIDTKLPKDIVQQGFNNLNVMEWRSSVYKSNGFFLKEPSTFCQFLAIAVIIEVVCTKQYRRLPIYFLGIGVTFSGTGLIILLIALPIYLIVKRQFLPLLLMGVVVFAAPIWMPLIGLSKTLDRINEFSNPRTSAYARFIAMVPMIDQYLIPHPKEAAFGKGAGSLIRVIAKRDRDYEVHNPTWGKIVFEYGFFGAFAFFTFFFYMLSKPDASNFIKLSIVIQFLILGEYLVAPECHALIAAMITWPFIPGRELNGQSESDALEAPMQP